MKKSKSYKDGYNKGDTDGWNRRSDIANQEVRDAIIKTRNECLSQLEERRAKVQIINSVSQALSAVAAICGDLPLK